MRSYGITGEVPGVSIFVSHLTGTTSSDLPTFGFGHSPLDLFLLPWRMTFQGQAFHQEGAGDIGVTLLMLTPLVLFAPRTRAMALLVSFVGFSCLGWAFTAQLTRYLLPTLAIVAALAGIGLASVGEVGSPRARRVLAQAAQASVIVGLVATPLLLANGERLGVPVDIDVVTGKDSGSAYVSRNIAAAPALAAATALLPPDTPVGYIGKWEGAQIYTEARLVYFGDPLGTEPDTFAADITNLGATPEDVLTNLQRLGIGYFVWDRVTSAPEVWRSVLLSTAFLRTHTHILAGDRGSYVFQVLPAERSGWNAGRPNLLQDPGFESIEDEDSWSTRGRIKARKGVVSLFQRNSSVSQRVAIKGGDPYLLLVSSTCAGPSNSAALVFHWLDNHDTELGIASEDVMPGVTSTEQFLWHTAPAEAVAVSVEVTDAGGCTINQAGLFDAT